MITRIWQGWTSHENADDYEHLLTTEVIPSVLAKKIPGLLGVEVFRRETDDETEFMTKYNFDSLDSVILMAGPDPEKSFVPASARKLLKRFEPSARHFEKRY